MLPSRSQTDLTASVDRMMTMLQMEDVGGHEEVTWQRHVMSGVWKMVEICYMEPEPGIADGGAGTAEALVGWLLVLTGAGRTRQKRFLKPVLPSSRWGSGSRRLAVAAGRQHRCKESEAAGPADSCRGASGARPARKQRHAVEDVALSV